MALRTTIEGADNGVPSADIVGGPPYAIADDYADYVVHAKHIRDTTLGGPGGDNRKAMTLTTALRNVGVGLVIATGNFADTPAVTATLAYGLFEIVGTMLLAFWWGRRAQATAAEAPRSQQS